MDDDLDALLDIAADLDEASWGDGDGGAFWTVAQHRAVGVSFDFGAQASGFIPSTHARQQHTGTTITTRKRPLGSVDVNVAGVRVERRRMGRH